VLVHTNRKTVVGGYHHAAFRTDGQWLWNDAIKIAM